MCSLAVFLQRGRQDGEVIIVKSTVKIRNGTSGLSGGRRHELSSFKITEDQREVKSAFLPSPLGGEELTKHDVTNVLRCVSRSFCHCGPQLIPCNIAAPLIFR